MSTGGDETQAMGSGGDPTQAMGGGPPDGGATPPVGDEGGDRRRMWMLALGVLLVGAIVGVGIALAVGGGGDDNTASSSSTSTSTSTSTTSTPTTSPPTTQPHTTTTKSNTTTSTTAPSNAPKINSFSTNPASKTCATETDSYSVTLSWNTSNTTQNALSVDGPGVYATYPGGSGSQVLTPGCPPESTSTQHHYTLTAKGPGGQVQKTITFSVNTVPKP